MQYQSVYGVHNSREADTTLTYLACRLACRFVGLPWLEGPVCEHGSVIGSIDNRAMLTYRIKSFAQGSIVGE